MANIIKITDLTIPELDVYARLSEVQLLRYNEPDLGLFICESPKVIMRALDAGYFPVSILVEEKEIKEEVLEIVERCDILCPSIPVYTANYETLSQLTGFNLTRGMLCCMKRNTLPSVEEIAKSARRVAVMEDVVNPTNVGAIFRSAAALNMDAILLTPACSNPLYRRAARVSMGTVFQAPWTFFKHGPSEDSQSHYVTELKRLGFKTVAFALRDDSISIDDPILASEEKLAIILGTEGEGLQNSTLAACDYTVKIPMSHGVDSLNVAAASAIAFWELGK
ncbi:MAG: RNA methyltransferase [Agathobacter sp.]|nr:RNA methyltransferase [Agathobacter sp.]